MQTISALRVDEETFCFSPSKVQVSPSPQRAMRQWPLSLGVNAPLLLQASSPSPKGRLLLLDKTRRVAPESKSLGDPLPGPGIPEGPVSVSPDPLETFKASIHLYAGRNQAKTLIGGLSAGDRPTVTITQWGNLPLYSRFLEEIGLAGWVEELEIKRRSDATPVLSLLQLGIYRLLLGYRYVDNLKYPLNDLGFLEVVGLEESIDPKTYANFFKAFLPEKLRQLHQKAVLKSNELGCDDGQGVYALDLSPLEVYGNYFEGAEAMRPKEGHPTKGFQVAALLRLGRHPTVAAIGIFPGGTDELDAVFPLINETRALLGQEAIRLLLVDRGFTSGEMLYRLKATYGIDWIIPAKDASYVDRAIKSLEEKDWKPTDEKHLRIASVEVTDVPHCPLQVTLILLADDSKKKPSTPQKPSIESRQEKLLAIPARHLKAFLRMEGLKVSGNKRTLVERILQKAHQGKVDLVISLFFKPPRKKVVEDQSIQGYLTSLQVEEKQLQATILTHRRRWDIENKLFRVCKEAFQMEYLAAGKWEQTHNHIYLMAMTFNCLVLFKKRMGESMEKISPQRLRQEFFQSFQLFVKAGEEKGIIGIELLMELFWEKEKQLQDLLLTLQRLKVEVAQDHSFEEGSGI